VLRFGTDGVRGVANVDLTPELVLALGRAAARTLGATTFAIGRDTRRSGPMLQAALTAGLTSEGAEVLDLGVVPTPVVAHAATDGGAMISASHNPFGDNGIKFFTGGGRKLTDDVEEALEAELDRVLAGHAPPPARLGTGVGTVTGHVDHDRYVSHVTGSIQGRRLGGLRVVVDCANGAASWLAPRALAALGADVTAIHAEPDGTNINERCGSTDPSDLCRAVVDAGADAGLAFDGDADRVVAVDADGHLVDGDQIIAVCALDRRDRGELRDDTVVITVMTNLGFRLAMAERGIAVVETAVGDRYVLDALERGRWSLGGEQSGHVIFPDLATTGDGLLTGVQLLDVVVRSGRPLAELAAVMTRLPQVLHNVRVATKGVDVGTAIGDELVAAEQELGERGRVLVRASGTEPLVRVMVEAESAEQAAAVADRLAAAVAAVTSAGPP
jgi:phosphoglucosamine mutase